MNINFPKVFSQSYSPRPEAARLQVTFGGSLSLGGTDSLHPQARILDRRLVPSGFYWPPFHLTADLALSTP